ncbi:MAG: potassium channel protein [Actinomycetota bacterium]
MIVGGLVLAGVCTFGVLGYLVAGWDFGDAIYMVVITIFGVGYGEVHPIDTWPLRGLTAMVIVVGYGAVIYTVGGFIQMVVDGELNTALGVRRMTRDIAKLENHVVVCGIGRMGRKLAAELHAAGKPFVAVDANPTIVDQAETLGYLALHGDASDEEVLSRAGIERASVLASVLSDDAANVFVTLTARSMRSDLMIVARGENQRTESKLLDCGADRVVLPTAIGASKMSQMILRPTADELFDQLGRGTTTAGVDMVDFGLEFDQVEIGADSSLAGRTLSQLDIRGAHGYLVVGVRHADGNTVLHPSGDTRLGVGDTVVVLGYGDDMMEVEARPTAPRSITYRGARMTLDGDGNH